MMKKQGARRVEFVGEYVQKSGAKINCAAIGPKSGGVFVTGDDSKNVCVWSMQSQVPIKVLSGHNSEVASMIFSRDEAFAFAGTDGGSIVVWDLYAQKIAMSLKEHRNSCTSLGIPVSLGHAGLVSGSMDTNVKVWDLRTGRSTHTFKEHTGEVNCVCFAPSGQWVSSAGEDGVIKVWGLQSNKLVGELKLGDAPVNCIQYNPLYYTLASALGSRVVRYWDLESWSLISESTLDTSPARRLTFIQDGKYLLSANNESVKVWGLEPLKLLDVKEMPARRVEDMVVSKEDGCAYVASSFMNSIGVYSISPESISLDGSALSAAEVPFSGDAYGVKKMKAEKEDYTSHAEMGDVPMKPAGAVAGSIITTKAEVPRPPAHQFNPHLVMRHVPDQSLEESSTILAKPVDKPINLDMNAFLGDTQKTKKDIDIINELKKDHTSIMAIVSKRQGHIGLIMKYWSQGDMTAGLAAINMINDPSVIMDVFNSTFAEGLCISSLNLDHLVMVLPHALSLVKSKYDCYIQAGLKTIDRLFKHFGEKIQSAKNVPLFGGVDLAREERLKKGEAAIEQFRTIFEFPSMRKLMDKPSDTGKLARRIQTDLEFFLKSCSKS